MWQNKQNMCKPSAPKTEPDIVIARFVKILIDEPSPSHVDSCYNRMINSSPTELDRKWFSISEPYHLEMTGHAVTKNYGPGQSLKNNGMSAALLSLDAKDGKIY